MISGYNACDIEKWGIASILNFIRNVTIQYTYLIHQDGLQQILYLLSKQASLNLRPCKIYRGSPSLPDLVLLNTFQNYK